ncbi:MAG: type II toxin-antitoxin system prevent-host-death family antitoxin [Acidimicrobiia bacterium]|nr:type II toxin-antitoxin system prevent-host-death family antitoxin [Acidimicrobiia bacterium]
MSTTVSVSELKARLSEFIREAKRGGEVQILDRGVPVARLTGLQGVGTGSVDQRLRLIRDGVLRAGDGDASEILDTPALRLPASLLEALDEDRSERL